MKLLNEDMINLAIANNQICTVYDDSYVLLFKRMPVVDDELEVFLNSMSKAKESGVNLATVVDLRLLEGHTSNYGEGVTYTKGVFLEERAKGVNLNYESIYLNHEKDDYDFGAIGKEYIKRVNDYISELENRNSVSEDVYEKLISDYIALSDFGLEPDPKPNNFFFDKSVGYTIIDPIQKTSKLEDVKKYIATHYIWGIVFGYGLPRISIATKSFDFLSEDLKQRMDITSSSIAAKIVKALRKKGFSEEDIHKGLSENVYKYVTKGNPIHVADIEIEIATKFAHVHEEEKAKSSQVSDGWEFN